MRNGRYCHPLTIADSKSRYLFLAQGQEGETFESVKRSFEGVFKEYSLPKQIHTDNGRPYVSASLKNKYVGIEEIGEGIYRVYYRRIFLGFFDDTILEKRGQVLKLQSTIV